MSTIVKRIQLFHCYTHPTKQMMQEGWRKMGWGWSWGGVGVGEQWFAI
jgi:hypothetical protein